MEGRSRFWGGLHPACVGLEQTGLAEPSGEVYGQGGWRNRAMRAIHRSQGHAIQVGRFPDTPLTATYCLNILLAVRNSIGTLFHTPPLSPAVDTPLGAGYHVLAYGSSTTPSP
jgi:hypothetical protein